MLVDSLPEFFIINLGVFGLIVTGYLVEKYYVSRPAIFANGIALNVHVYELILPPDWLLLYADVGLVVSWISILSYWLDFRLPQGYYNVIWYTYSSFTVGGVILLTLL